MLLACLPFLLLATGGRSAPRRPSLEGLAAKMERVAAGFHGVLGYSLHFRGGPEGRIARLGDERFPSASTIKTAIMVEALHQVEEGRIGWHEPIPVQAGLEAREEGGPAYYFRDGSTLPLSEWVHLMITASDNTATINLRNRLGQKNVNDWLVDHGFHDTLVLNGRETDALGLRSLQRQYGLGMTTPNEQVRLLEMIAGGKAGSPAACDRMLRLLNHQFWDHAIASQVPPTAAVGSKSGSLDESRSDTAIVNAPAGQYVLAVYTKELKDQRWTRDNEGEAAIRTLAALVWQQFDPHHTWTPPPGYEAFLPGG
jgi:beta-lactamase class A